ncbi:NAD-dependent epimerase/dehydratase family protein, partial [Staphylococcus aureus]|uniref:NAD-dependent epimerase/dehydratase family protein n=1 Tax=Staphylococcus aureus TaxID=1280 RepID=UPI0011A2D3C5
PFIFPSSPPLYAHLPHFPKTHQSLILPLSPYPIHKYYPQPTTLNYCSLYNIPTPLLKFFNLFPPTHHPNSQYSPLISNIFHSFHHNNPFTFFPHPLQTTHFLYLYHVLQSLPLIMEHK